MNTKSNLNRIQEVLITNNTNELDKISENDASNSDLDYSVSETESYDISPDQCILKDDDSSDYDIMDDDMFMNSQPESKEKAGV